MEYQVLTGKWIRGLNLHISFQQKTKFPPPFFFFALGRKLVKTFPDTKVFLHF